MPRQNQTRDLEEIALKRNPNVPENVRQIAEEVGELLTQRYRAYLCGDAQKKRELDDRIGVLVKPLRRHSNELVLNYDHYQHTLEILRSKGKDWLSEHIATDLVASLIEAVQNGFMSVAAFRAELQNGLAAMLEKHPDYSGGLRVIVGPLERGGPFQLKIGKSSYVVPSVTY